MSRIYWDTMLFAYWLEGNVEHGRRVQQIYSKMEERGDVLCTSVFTLGELLVGPYKRGANDVALQIRSFFESPAVEVLPFTLESAERYAHLRSGQRIAPADAIHLAAAGQAGVDLFLTNDHRLHGFVTPGIHFIAGMDVNLF